MSRYYLCYNIAQIFSHITKKFEDDMNGKRVFSIEDIQDEEDIYDRIKVKQQQRTKRKKKDKLKENDKVKENVYEDSEVIPPLLHEKVQLVETRIKGQNTGLFSSEKNLVNRKNKLLLSTKKRLSVCNDILNDFENYDLSRIAPFESPLQIHFLRLYIYYIMYSKEEYFEVDNIALYMKAFEALKNMVKQREQLRKKFTNIPIDYEEQLQDKLTTRTTEKIEIPSIILKRLNIQ